MDSILKHGQYHWIELEILNLTVFYTWQFSNETTLQGLFSVSVSDIKSHNGHITVLHSIRLGRNSDPGACRAAEYNLRSNLTSRIVNRATKCRWEAILYCSFVRYTHIIYCWNTIEELYLMVILTTLYLISVVYKVKISCKEGTKTDVEPTFLPIVTISTWYLLACV